MWAIKALTVLTVIAAIYGTDILTRHAPMIFIGLIFVMFVLSFALLRMNIRRFVAHLPEFTITETVRSASKTELAIGGTAVAIGLFVMVYFGG